MTKNPQIDVETLKKSLKKAFHDSLDVLTDEIRKVTPVDTGRLRNSIHSEVLQDSGDILVGVVGTDVEYAVFVEFGTVKMEPRAMFRIGSANAKERISQLFRSAFQI
jgi:HK97 gp10 family phage protein